MRALRLSLAALVAGFLAHPMVGAATRSGSWSYLGFAAFFFLTGRGPYAIDRLLFPTREPSPDLARRAMVYLRVATGLGLAVVAFTEKLADPALAQAFLQRYPLNARRGGAAPLGARSPRRPPRASLESRSAANVPSPLGADPGTSRHERCNL